MGVQVAVTAICENPKELRIAVWTQAIISSPSRTREVWGEKRQPQTDRRP